MYKFFDRNEEDRISLHDCKAAKMYLKKDILQFEFPDGFCIYHNDRPGGKGRVLTTDESRVDIHLVADDPSWAFTFYVFVPKKHGKVVRKQFSLKKLMRKINEKGRKLEFITAYRNKDTIVFECELWFKKRPYSRECLMILDTDSVIYRWNNVVASE